MRDGERETEGKRLLALPTVDRSERACFIACSGLSKACVLNKNNNDISIYNSNVNND